MFNAKKLSLARMRRRLTGKALAERSGLAVDTISRLEKGSNEPDDLTVAKLAKALEFPIPFFFGSDPIDMSTDAVSFRGFSRMSARERDAATSAGSLGLQLSEWIEERFTLPNPNLIDLSYEPDPEVCAYLLRQHWTLGERPIGNMLGLLETNGVRVFSLSENTASVNAFSFWRDEKPFVFLNNFKTAESSIFDSAHELGHLVMHKHGEPKESRASEREANEFASAFLLPKNDVASRMRHVVSVDTVLRAKIRWRVSAMAMVYRLRRLDIVSEWQYKSLCVELTKRGFRVSELVGVERETSLVWKKILGQLWSERITKDEIAQELSLPLDELEGLIWNLAHVIDRPTSAGRPALFAAS